MAQQREGFFRFVRKHNVDNLVDVLSANHFSLKSEIFLDEFWDTPDLALMQVNVRLKTRDGKIIVTHATKSSSEISMLVSNAIGKTVDFPTEAGEIKKICTHKLATLPTLRTVYTSPNEQCIVRIDTFKSNGLFWTVGSTNSMADVIGLTKKFGLGETLVPCSCGKLIVALKNGELSEALEGILSKFTECCNGTCRDLSFSGIEHSEFHYEKFDNARAIATTAQIPFKLAFRCAAELADLQ